MRRALLFLVVGFVAGCGRSQDVRFDLYLVALGPTEVHGEALGCGDVLVGVERKANLVGTPLETALRALLTAEDQGNLTNAVRRPGLAIESVTIDRGTATVRLTGPFKIRGVCDIPRIEMQLERTARQFSELNTVEFLVGNQTLQSFLSLKG